MNNSKTKSSPDVAEIVREANNEDQYRALFSDLLKSFSAARDNSEIRGASDAEDFEAEKKIVTEVARVESASFTAGVYRHSSLFLHAVSPSATHSINGKRRKAEGIERGRCKSISGPKGVPTDIRGVVWYVGWLGWIQKSGRRTRRFLRDDC